MADFTVSWQNLNYSILPPVLNLGRKKPTHILHDLSGHFKAGELVSLMGPSGAGKTTLLECLTGKRVKGLTGRIQVTHHGGEGRPLKIAIVPQEDHLLGMLTVRETLQYASQFRNASFKMAEHQANVVRILGSLSLTSQADTDIDQLSGGERKRVCVAQELLCRVDVLFLDEPTTGLDVLSAYKLMRHIGSVVESRSADGCPVAMIATIHQPATRVFHMFKRVYFLSGQGHALYDGPPGGILELISSLDPSLTDSLDEDGSNEADLMTEIAAGAHGAQILADLEQHLASQSESSIEAAEESDELMNDLISKRAPRDGGSNFLTTSITSFQRGLRINMANKTFLVLRLLVYLIFAICTRYTFHLDTSGNWACPDWRRDTPLWNSNFSTGDLQRVPGVDDEVHYVAMQQHGMLGTYFFSCAAYTVFIFFSTALIWPTELRIVRYETRNGWYGVAAYALGRGLADLPTVLTLPFMLLYIVHWLAEGDMSLYLAAALFVIVGIHAVAVEAAAQLMSIIIPGGLNVISFAFILAIQIGFLTEHSVRLEDVTSTAMRYAVRYSPNNVALRSLISLLNSESVGRGYRCRCNWPVISYDERPDWIRCLTFPNAELFYTDACQGVASDGIRWSLDELFKVLNFGGKYDRSICPADVANADSFKVLPHQNFQEEYAVWVEQPRGPRPFKPAIYHPTLMTMVGLDYGELWPVLILQLIGYALLFRFLCLIALKLRN